MRQARARARSFEPEIDELVKKLHGAINCTEDLCKEVAQPELSRTSRLIANGVCVWLAEQQLATSTFPTVARTSKKGGRYVIITIRESRVTESQ